ncbi:uncharacterized protein LOC144714994 [Wolffia australiana]
MEHGDAKRSWDDVDVDETPLGKKFRSSDLEVLDELDEAEVAKSDLADVMRSLEEEIASSSPSSCDVSSGSDDRDSKESDLGFLLEASDDELGLPPTETSDFSPPEEIWSLEEEISNSYDDLDYDAYEKRFWQTEADETVIYDGGLFDSPLEFIWLSETTPAM